MRKHVAGKTYFRLPRGESEREIGAQIQGVAIYGHRDCRSSSCLRLRRVLLQAPWKHEHQRFSHEVPCDRTRHSCRRPHRRHGLPHFHHLRQ